MIVGSGTSPLRGVCARMQLLRAPWRMSSWQLRAVLAERGADAKSARARLRTRRPAGLDRPCPATHFYNGVQ